MEAPSPRVGVMARLHPEGDPFWEVRAFGLSVCQLVGWEPELWTARRARRVREESAAAGVRATAFWAGWPGPKVWDFLQGPQTLGIVPARWRAERVAVLKDAGRFAREAGLPAVITHLGFLPEHPSDPLFAEVVEAVREIALALEDLGLEFWFETGQETPVAMLRLMREVGTGNLGVNLDPANLVLYGKANPVDALDVLGGLVRNVHAKDGLYPTDPMKLGREVKVGEGKVRFPELLRRLGETGFGGEFIIEREISGEEQGRDIAETVRYLSGLLEAGPCA